MAPHVPASARKVGLAGGGSRRWRRGSSELGHGEEAIVAGFGEEAAASLAAARRQQQPGLVRSRVGLVKSGGWWLDLFHGGIVE
ncbi:hypothetical protein E2562_012827, partial [Oryza meyeriana var. granulata]